MVRETSRLTPEDWGRHVDDLDALLAKLRVDGVTVDERTDNNELGCVGWIVDPEGTRVELWQPPA